MSDAPETGTGTLQTLTVPTSMLFSQFPFPLYIQIQFPFLWKFYGNPIPMGILIPMLTYV